MLKHYSVLLQETIAGLNIKSNGVYVDLTLGRAGHSKEILKRLDTGFLVGIDQDQDAIDASNALLSTISSQFKIVKSNFVHIEAILKNLGINEVDGILMDLGVSSPQFDDPKRGFSYREDARLDMRMDQSQSLSAYTVVNTYSVKDLTRIFQDYGDERYALSIAKNIEKYRQTKPIETTFELVDIIKKSMPMKVLSKVGHPAKQVFQAIRIEVNDELNVLKETLVSATKLLKSGGRLAVITFHSGEDKIVKSFFKSLAVSEGNRYDLPNLENELQFRLINTHPIVASEKELAENHRSMSAKLRIIEKK